MGNFVFASNTVCDTSVAVIVFVFACLRCVCLWCLCRCRVVVLPRRLFLVSGFPVTLRPFRGGLGVFGWWRRDS